MEGSRSVPEQTDGLTLRTKIPLSEHTSFRIGGNAAYWAEISSVPMLAAALELCRSYGLPYFVLGRGSNVLAADEGYTGMILHLGDAFSAVSLHGNTLVCEAGASLAKTAKTAAQAGLTGMEGLSGIPGTIGGALYMNAGAYGYEMKDIVTECQYMDDAGGLHTLPAEALALSYRHSQFMEQPGIITSVTLTLRPGDKDSIHAAMQELLARRSEKQPLQYPSAGSTFKRPAGSYASLLIDQCGLRGMRVGGAQVSEKHAGFVINTGDATCRDVLTLCEKVRQTVKEQTGYTLELEPVILGKAGDTACS